MRTWPWIVPLAWLVSPALAAEVVVERAGDGEKLALRYDPEVGVEHADTLSTAIVTSSTILGRSMESTVPRVVTTVGATVRPGDAGQFRVEFAYKDARLEGEGKGMGKMIGETIRQGLAQASGTLAFTAQGEIVEAKASLGGKEGEESFDFGQWIVRFPDQPVGLGARWVVTDDGTGPNGIAVKEKRTYTLVERSPSAVKLVVELESQGAPGAVSVEGMTAEVTRLVSTGTGTLELRLDRPLPVSGTTAMSTTLELTVAGMATTTLTRLDTRVGKAARP